MKARLRRDLSHPDELIFGYGEYLGRYVGFFDPPYSIDWKTTEWDFLQPDCISSGLNDGVDVNFIIAHNEKGVYFANSLDFEFSNEQGEFE